MQVDFAEPRPHAERMSHAPRSIELRLRTVASACLTLVASSSVCADAPRYFARPVPVLAHVCNPSNPQTIAPARGIALAADGRIACVSDCGSTVGGSRPFVVLPDGSVVEYPHGTFTFTTPAAFLNDGRLLLVGDWCPPVNGACTTAIAVAPPNASEPTIIGSSALAASSVADAQETGWAVGQGPIVTSGAWRVRPDGVLKELAAAKATGISVTGVAPAGIACGSAFIGGLQRAVRWDEAGAAELLTPITAGATSRGQAMGIDGSVVGQSDGRAVRWPLGSSVVIPLMPAGSTSVSLAMAGHPASANPLGYAIFGSHTNGTRIFRSNGSPLWVDLGPLDASAQYQSFDIVAAPRPDFAVASAHTVVYQPVSFIWTLGDSLRRLDSVIVNPITTGPNDFLIAVDANVMGTILVNAGSAQTPFTLTRLGPGDTNGDAIVDARDLGAVLSEWGAVPAGRRYAEDFDGDQVVGAVDLTMVLASWN